MKFLRKYKTEQGVFQISQIIDDFENCYLKVRTQEGRLHDDDIVRKLPSIDKDSLHYHEWKRRTKSTHRIINYLALQERPLSILDVGCGNGWFSNMLAGIGDTAVLGIDINMPELLQASRIFTRTNLFFAHVDFLRDDLPRNNFDVIILNSVIQYFPSLKEVLTHLSHLLMHEGEIHILDSPIYHQHELEAAKQRTKRYYEQQRNQTMQKYYHHHTWKDLEPFDPALLYNPKSIWVKVKNKIMSPDSPFAWIRMVKS